MFMYFGLDMYCTLSYFVIFTLTCYIHEKKNAYFVSNGLDLHVFTRLNLFTK
jgi:hypothetical protein